MARINQDAVDTMAFKKKLDELPCPGMWSSIAGTIVMLSPQLESIMEIDEERRVLVTEQEDRLRWYIGRSKWSHLNYTGVGKKHQFSKS